MQHVRARGEYLTEACCRKRGARASIWPDPRRPLPAALAGTDLGIFFRTKYAALGMDESRQLERPTASCHSSAGLRKVTNRIGDYLGDLSERIERNSITLGFCDVVVRLRIHSGNLSSNSWKLWRSCRSKRSESFAMRRCLCLGSGPNRDSCNRSRARNTWTR